MQKISIVTPSFNQGRYIRQTIESVLAQSYQNFEHIVIDGGSTDETVAILKEYPHLQWVSEKDPGQSNALNKGFAKITGDVVGWINSDDWYVENIFTPVVEALQKHPLVMGACELRDEHNQTMYVVPNRPRTWFDMLKYWVPYSIPAQPSIFFRRELLESARRPDGTFFDEDLHYCMDYDLWMRLAQQTPFSVSLGRILSYYRMTPENKTGRKTEGMPYAEPEMSRIFNRYKDVPFSCHYPLSIIVPISEDADYQTTIRSLCVQKHPFFEVLVAAYGTSSVFYSEIKKTCEDIQLEARTSGKNLSLQVLPENQGTFASCINAAINKTAGSLVAVLDTRDVYKDDFIYELLQHFPRDDCGGCSLSTKGWSFAARKLCFFEADGLQEDITPSTAIAALQSANEASGWTWKKA